MQHSGDLSDSHVPQVVDPLPCEQMLRRAQHLELNDKETYNMVKEDFTFVWVDLGCHACERTEH